MFIKIDKNGEIIETNTEKLNGYLDKEFDIDMDKFLFAKYVDGKIVYDNKKYKKSIENRTQLQNLTKEIEQIEEWFVSYDKVCNKHLRCERLGVECHHNIVNWDKQALDNISRLNKLKDGVSQCMKSQILS